MGFASETIRMPDTASTKDVLEQIDILNKRPDIHGLLVQLPLPQQIDKNRVLEAILPEKDVDGFHPVNMGRLVAQGRLSCSRNCFGIIEMLKREKVVMKGANAVMVGHSEIVGKPTALLLLNEWATVTICHVETKDLKMHTGNADILIVAAGGAIPYKRRYGERRRSCN